MTPKPPIPSVLSGTLPEVAAQLGTKTPIGSVLNSAEWADVAVKLREEAFFVSTLESVRAAGEMQRGLMDILEQTRRDNGTMVTDRSKWIDDMQEMMTRLGLRTKDPDKIGGLQDLGSERRLKLIRDFQIESTHAKANHIAGQDADVLQEWPAQELIRVVDAREPRDWWARWQEAGAAVGWEGATPAGMVALKTSPIWTALSRFGRPYPPFDYNSGMDLRDIDREEAEALGLVQPGEVLQPGLDREEEVMEAGLKKDLELPGMREALESVFGNQIRLTDDGRAVWRGGEVSALARRALAEKDYKGRVSLGKASPKLVDAARTIGEDLEGYEFDVSADAIRHAIKEHGGIGETARGQRPIRISDFALLPGILQNPDVIGLGKLPDTLGVTKEIDGNAVTIWFLRSRQSKKAGLDTLWVKK